MSAPTPSGSSPERPARASSPDPAASAIRQRVRDQYERYPYPPPAEFRSRMVAAFGLLDYVRHVL
jgi:hypothetical protein